MATYESDGKNLAYPLTKMNFLVTVAKISGTAAFSEVTGVEATVDGKVKITGTDEYQLLTKATLEWFNPSSKSYDCCANFGAFQDEAEGVVVKQGKQGFGTFRQITKDLRLPTAANTRWSRIAQDETPIVGGKYNEYIIYLFNCLLSNLYI